MYLVERFNKRFLSGKIIGAFENQQNDFRENESASQSLKMKTILEKKNWNVVLYPAAFGRHLLQLVHFEFLNGFFFWLLRGCIFSE